VFKQVTKLNSGSIVHGTIALMPLLITLLIRDFYFLGTWSTLSTLVCTFLLINILMIYRWKNFKNEMFKGSIIILCVTIEWLTIEHYTLQLFMTPFSRHYWIAMIAVTGLLSALLMVKLMRRWDLTGNVMAVLGLCASCGWGWATIATSDDPAFTSTSEDKKSHSLNEKIASALKPVFAVNPHFTTDAKEAPWSYRGESGAEFWSNLNPNFQTCQSGKSQSPIDLDHPHIRPITLSYHGTTEDLLAQPNSPYPLWLVQRDHKNGKGGHNTSASLLGVTYVLSKIGLHTPSEHTDAGLNYPGEVRYSFVDARGKHLEISYFIDIGASLPELSTIIDTLNNPGTSKTKISTLNFSKETSIGWIYSGSLTSPPCTEGITHIVYKKPLTMSLDQMALIAKKYPFTARHVQPFKDHKWLVNELPVAH
jgi:carbonic anhydrase